MKKNIIIAAATLLLFTSANVFAAKANATNFATPQMKDELQQTFGQVQNVAWQKRPDNLVVASFTFNNQAVDAYFDTDGNYSFCTTSIAKESLPIKVGMAVNKNFADCNIRAVLQMSNTEGTSYYILASDTNGKTKVWRAYDNGQIEIFKSI